MAEEVKKLGIYSIRTKLLITFVAFIAVYALGTLLSFRSIAELRQLSSVSPALVELLTDVNVYSGLMGDLDHNIGELFVADYPARRSVISQTLDKLEQTGQAIDQDMVFLGLGSHMIGEDAARVRAAVEDFLMVDFAQGANESIVRVYAEIREAEANRDRLFKEAAAFSEQVANERGAILDTLILELALIGLLMVLVVIGLLSFLLRSLIFPLGRLSEDVKSIHRGEFGKKSNIHTRDELGQLAHVLEETSETLKESQRLPDSILRSMKDSLFVMNSAGLITEVNVAALKVVGYTKEELIGKPLSLIFNPVDTSYD